MKRKKLTNFATLLVAISFPVLIIFSSFYLVLFDRDYYLDSFNRTDVYKTVPDADETLDTLLFYFRGKTSLAKTDFTQEEKAHFADVRNLVFKSYWLCGFCLVLFLIAVLILAKKRKKDNLIYSFFFGSLSTLFVTFVALVVNFDKLFTGFHIAFFPRETWMFPAGSKAITMFPEVFFYEIFKRIFITVAIVSVFILIFSRLLLFLYHRVTKKHHI